MYSYERKVLNQITKELKERFSDRIMKIYAYGLSLKLIKPGILPIDIIKKFKSLLSQSADVDYGDFDTIDGLDAEDSLKSAEQIIKAIENARKNLVSELE
jgi:hypothetical protein